MDKVLVGSSVVSEVEEMIDGVTKALLGHKEELWKNWRNKWNEQDTATIINTNLFMTLIHRSMDTYVSSSIETQPSDHVKNLFIGPMKKKYEEALNSLVNKAEDHVDMTQLRNRIKILTSSQSPFKDIEDGHDGQKSEAMETLLKKENEMLPHAKEKQDDESDDS